MEIVIGIHPSQPLPVWYCRIRLLPFKGIDSGVSRENRCHAGRPDHIYQILQQTIQGTQETLSSNEEIIKTHAFMAVQNQTTNETEVEQEIMKRKLLWYKLNRNVWLHTIVKYTFRNVSKNLEYLGWEFMMTVTTPHKKIERKKIKRNEK